jgi:hypothetical protein
VLSPLFTQITSLAIGVFLLCSCAPVRQSPCGAVPGNLDGSACQVCSVVALHPTQMAVGMRQVEGYRAFMAHKSPEAFREYLWNNPEPTVRGPGNRLYIIDHHHLARVLADMGEQTTWCLVQADFSGLPEDEFWKALDERGWVYPVDENGVRRPYRDIPESVVALRDDPYRSLAGAVREGCGFRKTDRPFVEFAWGGYLRSRVSPELLEKDFAGAVAAGVARAHEPAARDLPGWCGNDCSCR